MKVIPDSQKTFTTEEYGYLKYAFFKKSLSNISLKKWLPVYLSLSEQWSNSTDANFTWSIFYEVLGRGNSKNNILLIAGKRQDMFTCFTVSRDENNK